jgi:hypothetical protein
MPRTAAKPRCEERRRGDWRLRLPMGQALPNPGRNRQMDWRFRKGVSFRYRVRGGARHTGRELLPGRICSVIAGRLPSLVSVWLWPVVEVDRATPFVRQRAPKPLQAPNVKWSRALPPLPAGSLRPVRKVVSHGALRNAWSECRRCSGK